MFIARPEGISLTKQTPGLCRPQAKQNTACLGLRSLSEFERQLLICVLFHDLGDGKLEVLLSDMDTAFTQRIHAGLHTDTLGFGTRASWHQFSNLSEVNSAHQVHIT